MSCREAASQSGSRCTPRPIKGLFRAPTVGKSGDPATRDTMHDADHPRRRRSRAPIGRHVTAQGLGTCEMVNAARGASIVARHFMTIYRACGAVEDALYLLWEGCQRTPDQDHARIRPFLTRQHRSLHAVAGHSVRSILDSAVLNGCKPYSKQPNF